MTHADDILETAKALVAEHGHRGAAAYAVEAITQLYDEDDRYGVSVWREIRKVIAELTAEAEAAERDVEKGRGAA